MKLLPTILLSAAIGLPLSAQTTHFVRGDVDSVSGTNQFVLECTTIPLVSSAVNLQQLHDATRQQDLAIEMTVRDIGTTSPVLDVLSAQIVPERMDMGNLRFGRSESWEVYGTNGSFAAVFVNARAATSFMPFGNSGAWLLGPSAVHFTGGFINNGRFRFQFTMPTIPSLVGQEFSSQAIVLETSGSLLITEPDCKEVRAD